MSDRFRLFITGAVALVAVGVTFAAPTPWSLIHFDDDEDEQQAVVQLDSLKNFDGITLEGPDDVIVTQGDKFGVMIEGDKDAPRFVDLNVRDGVLVIGRRGRHWNGNATIHVTMPGLTRVLLSGSGDMQVEKSDSKAFSALITGSGDMNVNEVIADNVQLTLRGSGDVAMAGTTRTLGVNLFGSGDIRLDDLNAQTADITLRGSGSIQAHASGSAKLDVTGSGDAHVSGTTQCQISKVGSGDAECTT